MPSFDTPEPISVTALVGAGSLRLTAADRTDTVVEVRPMDPEKDKDVRTAEQTEVVYTAGVLTVRTKQRYLIGPVGAVEVTIDLPTGSRADLTSAFTQVVTEGRLGEVQVKNSAGAVHLDTTGPLKVNASHGQVVVERVEGAAEITSSTGTVRVGTVDGPAVLKNSHGATTVGTVTGDLRVRSANGGIDIARAEASVTGAATNGHLRVAEVSGGEIRLETSNGPIEVGIREGVAAWLDVSSHRGQVRNAIAASEAPDRTEDTVAVHARSGWGNIDIRRARS
jgi:hypothetical protein